MAGIASNRKDRLFRFIFGNEKNKAWTLSLYNAVNGSSYTDFADFTITTIENVVYMGMKNDLSFLVGETMNFYEQQATYNPNMPIRFLMYAGLVYSKYIENHNLNIYGKTQQKLPVPKLICFYNGETRKDDCVELSLAEAFPKGTEPDIAVRVKMLNINFGRNMELLNSCRALYDYSWLIERIRVYVKESDDPELAVDRAIDELPEDSEIKTFLLENRAEVKMMCITEYDEIKTMNMFKEEGYEEGREEGREEGAIAMLAVLVQDKIISVVDAAKRINMTPDEFMKAAGIKD